MKIMSFFEVVCAVLIVLIMLFAVVMLPLPTTCEQRSAIEIPRCK